MRERESGEEEEKVARKKLEINTYRVKKSTHRVKASSFRLCFSCQLIVIKKRNSASMLQQAMEKIEGDVERI